MNKIAFVFPGQGSQQVGMGKDVIHAYNQAKVIFNQADDRLGVPLSQIILNGPEEELKKTENTQPAIVTVSVALYELLKQAGIKPDFTCGHSLGEYSALVASGSLSFDDAVYAVRRRGLYMEEAVPSGSGAMSAVLGMKADKLKDICSKVTLDGETVQVANHNSPSQIVISGSKEGVEKASILAKEQGAKRIVPLNVSGPFHSTLMAPAAEKFSQTLQEITIHNAEIPVIANVTADVEKQADQISDLLIKQLTSPVRWVESIEKLKSLGVDTYVEVGPGNVLSGLIKKIDRQATILQVNSVETLEPALEVLEGRK
ncbi:ACP S-malonyltransferase [Terrilactibacillus laevilacticus]|uniref:Malonyl CoA-acyl carrier protein transacylase n=1 Tax=Terrilactibacillus laevilacticus TaxID=1380157 RepID=A0ABW5PPY3_9BACI|nr:ACP S-malonyltransferase [Terrilactibacillus laevilacticus]